MTWVPKEFSVINQYIKEKISDPSIVKGQLYSYLKLFQHGLSYSLMSAKTKKTYNPFSSSLFNAKLKYFIASVVKRNQLPVADFKPIVVLDGQREVSEMGEPVSVVFGKIIPALGRSNLSWIDSAGKFAKKADVFFPPHLIARAPLDKTEIHQWKDLQSVYLSASLSKKFSGEEMQYIGAAFHVFFEAFRKYYRLLKNKGVKFLYFYPHYHQEGLIAACKTLGIQTIEAQHGIIAKQDIYYVYEDHWKPVLTNAFFPDRILVFGNYWKNILLSGNEFSPGQITVLGDFIHRRNNPCITAQPGKTILIATQKNMHGLYIRYISKLSERLKKENPDWNIIAKLHPLEKKKDEYEAAFGSDNCVKIVFHEPTIDELLTNCSIQISSYSTTLFEGIGSNATGMVLLAEGPGIDYARDLVEQGIAIGITEDDNPVEKFYAQKIHPSFERKELYDEFRPKLLTTT